jgi:hypothetical protein
LDPDAATEGTASDRRRIHADFTAVRALLRCGRQYDKAVESFEPYSEIKEVCDHARTGMRKIVERALKTRTSAFVFVNNRLEGTHRRR